MLNTPQLAAKANVSLNTPRNYAKWFPDLFSEGARGVHGSRRFNDEDVEVFCTLVALKNSGMALAEAADKLRSQEAPAIVDAGATPDASVVQVAPSTLQEAQGAAITVQMVQSIVQTRMEAIQRRALWSHGVAFYAGMVTMGVVFLVVWWLVNGGG